MKSSFVKHIAYALLISVILFAHTACSSTLVTTRAQGAGESPIHMVTDSIPYSVTGAGGENGYYYLSPRSDGLASANIRYIDYASAKDVFLSSQINSTHNTETDESYLASTIGGGKLFLSGDSLFFLRCGSSGYIGEYGENALPAIYQMDLDGSNRKLLYQAEAFETFLTTIAADENHLYCIVEKISKREDGSVGNARVAVQIDKNTGESKELQGFPMGTTLIGAKDEYLIFQSVFFNPEVDLSVAKDSQAYFDSQLYEIFAFSVTQKKSSVIKSWKQADNVKAYVYQDFLVTASGTSKQLSVQNILTGAMINTVSLDDVMTFDDYPLWNDRCIDESFLFLDETFSTGLWSVGLLNGEKKHVLLSYYDAEKSDQRPLEIIASFTDWFLVRSGTRFVPIAALDKNGVATTVDILQDTYSLILKEDYWNSRQSCIEIEFIS